MKLTADQFSALQSSIRETGAGYEAGDIHDALHEAACDCVHESLTELGLDADDLDTDQNDMLEVAFKDGFWTDATEATGLLHSVMEWYDQSTEDDLPADLVEKVRVFLIGYTPPAKVQS